MVTHEGFIGYVAEQLASHAEASEPVLIADILDWKEWASFVSDFVYRVEFSDTLVELIGEVDDECLSETSSIPIGMDDSGRDDDHGRGRHLETHPGAIGEGVLAVIPEFDPPVAGDEHEHIGLGKVFMRASNDPWIGS